MRSPSTEAEAYAFWRKCLAGERVARVEDIPEAGFYAMRMVRGGPLVPVMVSLEQEIEDATGELAAPERYAALVNGEPRGQDWLRRRWSYLRPITAEHFDSLTGARDRIEEMHATHARLDLGAIAPLRRYAKGTP